MSGPLPATPFEGSRRLTGPNLYFVGCGVVLETRAEPTAEQIACWHERVSWATAELGWPEPGAVVRAHPGGAALAFRAEPDQLLTATEVNEWAWCVANAAPVLHAPGHPAIDDAAAALRTLRSLAAAERDPALRALAAAAARRGVDLLWDDEAVSLGLGAGSLRWSRGTLPDPLAVAWERLHRIPVALVTGSNGKTTTVRLIAACCRAQGWRSGHNCTDGLFLDGTLIEPGDWSGPAGARAVLRNDQVEAAVLETARGGILRRGLAFDAADVAVVTNISVDHFGEYGIASLADLAEAKLVVARGLRPGGWLVLNADDAELRSAAPVPSALAWFASDLEDAFLAAQRAQGRPVCGERAGRLVLARDGTEHDLGAIADMPLSVAGAARYNIANLAAAALAAAGLGVAPAAIAATFAHFGSRRSDNPGRLQRWTLGGAEVLVDYAHNPAGLEGLLAVARALHGDRVCLLLGQAGNRGDAEIAALARSAAGFAPEVVVLKDLDGYLRGRAPGEVPRLLAAELERGGVPAARIRTVLPELQAARTLLAQARAGDVLVMPMHALAARAAVTRLLDALAASGWRCGDPLPSDPQAGDQAARPAEGVPLSGSGRR